jgi:hypothetical protein
MRPVWVGAVAVGVLSAFSLAVLAGHGWDPKAFVLERPAGIPPEQDWAVGYDGQQSYAIALDPFGPAQGLDYPAYRYLRILYPLLARLLALGSAPLIPWTMLIVNLAAAGLSAGFLASLLERRGVHGAWALVAMLSFNYLIVVRFDLTEPLALALALAGLWAYERDRLGLAGLAFAAGALSREITLAFPLALALYSATHRRWKRTFLLTASSVGVYLLWWLIVWMWLSESRQYPAGLSPSFPPLSGLMSLQPFQSRVLVLLWAVAPAMLGGVAALWDLVRGKGETGESSWLLLANAGLILLLPMASWVDPLAVLRLALGAQVAILLWSAQTRPRFLRWAAALWAPSVLMVFIIPGYIA